MSLVGLFFNLLLYPLFFFFPLFTSFYTVAPQQHVLVTFWGSLAKVAKRPGAFNVGGGGEWRSWSELAHSPFAALRPGLYWFPVFGRSMVAIPTSMQTLDIKRATVVDKNGNPIVVSGVVTFQVVDSVRAAFGNPTPTLSPLVV
jgi:regulator of protease activity HflC (stomatin/prohibitin superfamily)